MPPYITHRAEPREQRAPGMVARLQHVKHSMHALLATSPLASASLALATHNPVTLISYTHSTYAVTPSIVQFTRCSSAYVCRSSPVTTRSSITARFGRAIVLYQYTKEHAASDSNYGRIVLVHAQKSKLCAPRNYWGRKYCLRLYTVYNSDY